MITSFIPGRIRIRHAALKDPETASSLAAGLNSHPGVNRAIANPVTGGLLIEYDPASVDMESARQALKAIAPEGEDWLEEYGTVQPFPIRPGRSNKDAAEYLAMIGAFIVCSGSAALRSKGLHVYSGLTLAGLTVQHLYKYRKRLLASFKKSQTQ